MRLVVVCEQDDFARMLHDQLFGIGLAGVSGGESSFETQAHRPHESFVNVNVLDQQSCEGTDDGLGEPAKLAADQDQSGAGPCQFDRGAERVCYNRDVRPVLQQTRQLQNCAPAVQKNRIVGLDVFERRFRNAALLDQALTHRSYGSPHNERLEFLGDGVLGCVVAELLYSRFPSLSEGKLTRLRAGLVREETLFDLARKLGLGEHLHLGDGELANPGGPRASILADAMEAMVGAVLPDGGYDAARGAVRGGRGGGVRRSPAAGGGMRPMTPPATGAP